MLNFIYSTLFTYEIILFKIIIVKLNQLIKPLILMINPTLLYIKTKLFKK